MRYRQFVQQATPGENPLRFTKFQLILGDDQFASEHRNKSTDRALSDAVKLQQPKHATLSLGEFQARYAERDEAMARAFWSTAFPMTAIARHFRRIDQDGQPGGVPLRSRTDGRVFRLTPLSPLFAACW
ncbi:hypothetical protein LP420_21805 [Massilia sp. B-10]|nr:hypothetical protein LP420_21805 [Massilia sp. B-10]